MLDPNADGLQRVRTFWDTEPCGDPFIRRLTDRRRDFFSKCRELRYRTEWHIPGFASFADAHGKQVLEIGCGDGVDGVMFAAHGARYTGVDLTEEAVDATRRHFAVEGLDGQFRQENAEQLSFADDSFDIVYSFSALHHTPTPERAVREVHRVLKPGGVALVMLYHRNSFNYYARILGYMRAKVLLEIVAREGSGEVNGSHRGDAQITGLRGNASPKVWDLHYDNFLASGWRYLRARNFVHHCTDGPECPYAYTFSKRDAAKLFAEFDSLDMALAHFPLSKYVGHHMGSLSIERALAKACGWHLLIRARK